jgi:hypothetical protein
MGRRLFSALQAEGFAPTAKLLLTCFAVSKLQAKTQRNTPHSLQKLKPSMVGWRQATCRHKVNYVFASLKELASRNLRPSLRTPLLVKQALDGL